MKLETYRWEKPSKPPAKRGRPTLAHCEHDDCFTCPYEDCIATDRDIAEQCKEENENETMCQMWP